MIKNKMEYFPITSKPSPIEAVEKVLPYMLTPKSPRGDLLKYRGSKAPLGGFGGET